uniref:Uncharacterized protein n=1 Tax=Acrobeloides nanus TaxID=290746 RepID=A0A914CNL6_9BILA
MTRLAMPRKTTFYQNLSNSLFPAIDDIYEKSYKAVNEIITSRDPPTIHLAGDGRYDSRGYSAEFCTYSLLDVDSKLIVEQVTLKKSDEKCPSNELESRALQAGLNHLQQDIGLDIESLTTDQHTRIIKLMREKFGSIDHRFDGWHQIKNLEKHWRKLLKNALLFRSEQPDFDNDSDESEDGEYMQTEEDIHNPTEGNDSPDEDFTDSEDFSESDND